MANESKYNIRRVSKLILIVSWFFLILMGGATASQGNTQTMINSIITLITLIIATILFFMNRYHYVIGFIVSFTPIFTAIYGVFANLGSDSILYTVFLGLTFATLYFNQKLILLYAASTNLFLLASIVFMSEKLFTGTTTPQVFIPGIIMTDISMVLLFFLAKWGNQLLKSLDSDKLQIGKHLENAERTILAINTTTLVLDNNVTTCSASLEATCKSSDIIT
ncbi:MAG: hypothetical protein H7X94_06155, partial [Vallitaleaceae bacterium]|nr:hypothetical protein [Vallitaleaceae bacterium]